MRYLMHVITIVLMSVLLSCATTEIPRKVIFDNYKNKERIVSRTLGVIIDNSNIFITNESSFFDDFGEGNPNEMYTNFLQENFPKAARESATFRVTKVFPLNFEFEGEVRKLQINEGWVMEMKLPRDGSIVKTDSLHQDYMLFVRNFKTGEGSNTTLPLFTIGQTMNVTGYYSYRYLITEFEFALWNNQKGELVTYGVAKGAGVVSFNMNQKTWLNSLIGAMRDVVTKTPFERPIHL
ncbi:MAG: hypothetical protein Kow00108_15560 [Calditrichia bacterium]